MIGQTLFNALVIGRMCRAPVQSLVIATVLVLGVIGGMTLGLVDDAVRASIAAGVARFSDTVNLQVTATRGTLPEETVRIVRGIPGLREAQPVVAGTAQIATPDGVRLLRLEGVDLFALRGDHAFRESLLPGLYADRGTLVPLELLLDENAIVVSPAFLAAIHAHLGERLTARVQVRRVRLVLAAPLSDSLHITDPNVALLDIGTAQRLFGTPGRIDRIDIAVPDDQIAFATAELARRLPATVHVEQPANRLAALGRSVSGVRGALAVLSLVIALLAAVVVMNAAGSAVIERARDIAILRALGVTRSALTRTFLIEGLVYGVGASFFGMLLGGLVAPALVRSAQAVFAAGAPVAVEPALAIDLWTQLRVFALSALLATVAGILPALQLVRGRHGTRRTQTWLWGRGAFATGGGAIVAALILRFAGIGSSLPALLVLVGSCACIAPAIAALALMLLRVRALPRPQTWLAAVFAREPAPAAVLGMATLVVAIALLASASIVEASERTAALHIAKAAYPGDLIVRDPYGELRGALVPERLARGLVQSATHPADPSETVLVIRPGIARARVLAALAPAALVHGVTIEPAADLLRAATAPVEAIFALVRIALALTFAIAIAGVTSGAFSAVLDRRDQIATLRSVGASRAQIVRMIFAESVLRAIAGCGLGTLAAFAIAFIVLANLRVSVPAAQVTLIVAAGATAAIVSALPGSIVAGRIRADRGIGR